MTGRRIAAWRGPEGSSLVIFRSLPIPDPSPESLAREETNRLRNLPGVTVEPPRTVPVGGVPAARIEAVGPGTGDAFAPSGVGVPVAPEGGSLIPTHRIAFGRPEPDGTLWLLWHFPESARATIEPQIDVTLRTVAPR